MVSLGLDKEKLNLQIARLEESLKRIKAIKKDKLNDTTRAALERTLQVIVEESLNIGNHLISGLGLRRADTYREIFLVLEEEKAISSKVSKEMQNFAVFRNRLVHLYWKISDEEFKSQLDKLNVFIDFVKEMTIFLHKKKLW